jgi:hypothetical protein
MKCTVSFKGKTKKQKGYECSCNTIRIPEDYPWKVLSALAYDLADVLGADNLNLISLIIRERDVYAYRILSEEWGLQFCNSPNNSDSLALRRAKYQISALLSRFQFKGDKDLRQAAAIGKFLDAETACHDYNLSGYRDLVASKTEFQTEVFTNAKGFLEKLLGNNCPTHEILTKWSRHGPGANLDTQGGQIDIYNKYLNWPYSCTQLALPYAIFLIKSDKRWLGFLEDDYRNKNNIPMHVIIDQKKFIQSLFTIVPGNKITFVPKNALTERSIAIEPAMNLFLQLGVDGFIRSRLKRWDVDLDSQDKNRQFARLGSLDSSLNSYVTLDLKAASDSISTKLVEILLPPNWYSYLMKLRSPSGTLNGETISYEKISSMGNGYTFALESAIFTALTYGVVKAINGNCDPKTDFSIFGDDIIVRKRYVEKIISTFNRAGFQLNLEKSYYNGFVRESCGTDWIYGKPCRPIFLSEFPSTFRDLLVDRNRLKRILELRWGIEESKTVSLIDRWLPLKVKNIIGPYSDEEFDSYLHSKTHTNEFCNFGIKFGRFISKPIVSNDNKNFFCRKLMNQLRGLPIKQNLFNKKKVNKGSNFDVILRNKITSALTYSTVDKWTAKYADVNN